VVGTVTASADASGNLTLTAANLSDANPGGSVTQVAFYLDGNGDGQLGLGGDQLLGYGTHNADGTWTYTFSTSGLADGTYTIFAQSQDNLNLLSNPLALPIQVSGGVLVPHA
jgi:hypothetical protein